MNTKDEDILKRYVEAAIIPRMYTDNIKYPIRGSRVNHLFLKECIKEFIDDFNELKQKGYSYEDIGKLFRNPSRLMRNVHHLLKGAKLNGFSIEQQREFILEILKIIKTQKSGNIFNEDKNNIVLDPEELSRIMKEKQFIKPDKNKTKLIQRLCGMLWAYSEAPFFVAHDIGMEEHGLYDYSNKKIMFRDFFNLKPTELWEECKEFPFNEIRIICIYNNRFKVDFDAFDNIYPNQGNVVEDLEEFYIEADGRILGLDDFHKLIEISSKIIESISKKIESMNEREIGKKYADIYWYRKRPLRDALGKDWRPPKYIYDVIEKGEIKPVRTKNPTPDEIREKMGLI